MVAMRSALALAVLAGCGSSGTGVVVDVTLRAGDPAPDTIAVSVFAASGALVQAAPVTVTVLPGKLLLRDLPDVDQTLRVALVGKSTPRTLAGASVQTRAHQQVEIALELSADTPDADGDAVPDSIDDCPTVPDPQQNGACSVDLAVTLPPNDQAMSSGDLATPARCGAGVASRCASASVAFCDDFESGMLSASSWHTSLNPNGAISVDGTRACRGTHAVKNHIDLSPDMASYAQSNLSTPRGFPANPIYLRWFAYVPSTTPLISMQLAQIDEPTSPFGGVVFGIDDTRNFYSSSYNITAGTNTTSASFMPLDQWVCFEWMVSSASGGGESRFWINGNELADLRIAPISPSPPFGEYVLGSDANGQSLAPFDLWLDEVIVDSQPIGCDK
jgi:hypothetical protein